MSSQQGPPSTITNQSSLENFSHISTVLDSGWHESSIRQVQARAVRATTHAEEQDNSQVQVEVFIHNQDNQPIEPPDSTAPSTPTSVNPTDPPSVPASFTSSASTSSASTQPAQPAIDFDAVRRFDRLTVEQIRAELRNQGVAIGRVRLKNELIALLVQHLQSGAQLEPFTDPVDQLIRAVQEGRRLPASRRAPRVARGDRQGNGQNGQNGRNGRNGRNNHRAGRGNPVRVGRILADGELQPTSDTSETEHVTAPPVTNTGNPYIMLVNTILDEIAEERDVDIGRGALQERATRLFEYDSILPQWIERLRNVSLYQLRSLSRAQLYVYASLRNITLTAYTSETMESLRGIIRALILCPTIGPTPPANPARVETTSRASASETAHEITTALGRPATGLVAGMTALLRACAERRDLSRLLHPSTVVLQHILPNLVVTEAASVLERLMQYPIRVSPNEYLLIRRIPLPILIRALEHRQVPHNLVIFLSHEDCIFTLTRGYPPPFRADIETIRARYNELLVLPQDIKDTLMVLYRTAEEMDPIAGMAKKEPVPLEAVIRLMQSQPIALLAQHVGMTIPPHLDSVHYFRNNILQYEVVLQRPTNLSPLTLERLIALRESEVEAYLKQYTDEEIMSHTGAYVNYSSRHDLIANLSALRTRENFFIPLTRNCRNRYTQLFSETNDPNLFIVAFGTLTRYVGYEIDELLSSFSYNESIETSSTSHRESEIRRANRGDFIFRHPEDTRVAFTVAQIDQLHQLLLPWSTQPMIPALIARINEGLMEARQKTDYDRQLLRAFRQVVKDQQLVVREYLFGLFQAGMYMRRWEGQGHPYPQKSNQTENVKISPDANTLKALQQLHQIIDQFDPTTKRLIYGEYVNRSDQVSGGLRVVEYFGPQPEQSRSYISELMYQVIRGDFCIRMASSKFIGTGSYYLRLLFNENIPDFDPTHVDRIY